MTRLLLLGNPRTGSWKWDIADAASRLGWQVTHLAVRGIPVAEVVRQARGADMLLWAKTHHHDPQGDGRRMLRQVEETGCITVGLHLDLYWGIPRREAQIGVDPWWTCRWVYTADGGDRPWASRGVNHRWCPPAVGRRWLDPCDGKPGRHRVVFVGSYSPRVHGDHRKGLLDWAHRTYGPKFGHHGASPRTRVTGHDLCGIYRGAHVVLGDSAPAPHYWSDRIPAVMARGAVLAHSETPGMAGQGFTAEVMLPYRRGDFRSLGRTIANLTPQHRAELGQAAQQLVHDRHTWDVRLEQIAEEVLG